MGLIGPQVWAQNISLEETLHKFQKIQFREILRNVSTCETIKQDPDTVTLTT